MKHKLILFSLLLALSVPAFSETKEDRASMPHEVRIGWGDQLFETLIWHEDQSHYTTMPDDMMIDYNENYRYSQHWWVEYSYRFNHWFSLGAMVDMSGVSWDVVTYNGKGVKQQTDADRHNFYNLVAMPTVRFTFYNHPYVNLYAGLGAGACVNGGTELSSRGRHVEPGMAANVTLLGVSANYDRWFGTFEFGGMYALRNMNNIYLAKSRMLNVAVGCRF